MAGARVWLHLLRRSQGKQLALLKCQSPVCAAGQFRSSQPLSIVGRLIQTTSQLEMETEDIVEKFNKAMLKATPQDRTGLLSKAREPPEQRTKLQTTEERLLHQDTTTLNDEPGMQDRLILEGLVFHGFHGVYAEERRLGQKFVVDVDVWTNLSKPCDSDLLHDSISYADIYRLIKEVVEGEPQNLLESVAQRIAYFIFDKYATIREVRVKVRKPHVSVLGVIDALGVEIRRKPHHLGFAPRFT